jgi:hypothetical protein
MIVLILYESRLPMIIDKRLLVPHIDSAEIVVNYLAHSTVAIRTGLKLMIFDYPFNPSVDEGKTDALDFMGLCSLSDIDHLEVFIFASHRHGDHYSPHIFELPVRRNLHYFMSFDISLPSTGHEVNVCNPHEWVESNGVKVFSGPSSDEGVAFFVEAGGNKKESKTIYYSGDNAFWDWNKCRVPEGYFKDYLQPFIDLNQKVDVAFTVADPRCFETHYGGIFDISTFLEIGLLVPIHNFGDFTHHKKMEKLVKMKHRDQNYFNITGPGEAMVYRKPS